MPRKPLERTVNRS